MEDIGLIRREVDKFETAGPESILSKTINEAGFQLKRKLDKGKFDGDDFSSKRKEGFMQIDIILAELKAKIAS
jgi:hypothetical protein